ncbi:hypothetical protein HYPSUDRAFT_87505 [Hypholoma sublateritium FD-334 SS-4]|uniref:Uncharacterized protein n=1 Tax=Hypholoma sublateritium (strain FD-334 SS-4) TaxID=945553 RepID=A0A0D2L600_HYPSF|nr:hypothetical protein HYPSUDRAFT_87505 [Hypholoma sublateritium FD-334 SS-4]
MLCVAMTCSPLIFICSRHPSTAPTFAYSLMYSDTEILMLRRAASAFMRSAVHPLFQLADLAVKYLAYYSMHPSGGRYILPIAPVILLLICQVMCFASV